MRLTHVGFVLKPHTPQAAQVADRLATALKRQGVGSLSLGGEGRPRPTKAKVVSAAVFREKAELAIVIGGDGTFLGAAHVLYGCPMPLIGVNLGRVGFLTEVDADKAAGVVTALMEGTLDVERRPYFLATVRRGRTLLMEEPFVNDVVLQRDAADKMISYALSVGGQPMSVTRADGLIVSTPTGSTAYNLSNGGPIVAPGLEGLVLAPICPHRLSFRPVVVPPAPVELTLHTAHGHLSADGRDLVNLNAGDVVTITRSPHMLYLMHDPARNFFDVLRAKLGWDTPIEK